MQKHSSREEKQPAAIWRAEQKHMFARKIYVGPNNENKKRVPAAIGRSLNTTISFPQKMRVRSQKRICSKKDNDLYYGEMYLDNHLRIGGTYNNPVVDGNIKACGNR